MPALLQRSNTHTLRSCVDRPASAALTLWKFSEPAKIDRSMVKAGRLQSPATDRGDGQLAGKLVLSISCRKQAQLAVSA
jgi:hypothetical protein